MASTQVGSLAEDVAILKRAVASRPIDGDGPFGTGVKVPEPNAFGGTRSSKELSNYLWDVEQYFLTAKIPAARQVSLASMYLTGDAKLWWRAMCTDITATKVETWADMKREMKTQFLPTNASWKDLIPGNRF